MPAVLCRLWPHVACIVLSIVCIVAASSALSAQAESPLTKQEIDDVLGMLEDPEQRAEITQVLRALSEAADQQQSAADDASVKSAAADLVQLVADNARDASQSAGRLLETVIRVPTIVAGWAHGLADPQQRERALSVAWRLAAVLGAGFVAAIVVRWLTRRLLGSPAPGSRLSLLQRLGRLSAVFVLDLLPVAALALVSYGVLTFVDPAQETRLVAVALINASVFSRLVLALAAFVLSPQVSETRLWTVGDESANYAYQWIRRLSMIGIYGFFGLQAAYLLGLESAAYASLMRLLGLVILLMLLVLIAQNRHDVARAIASEKAADIDEPAPVSSLRRGLGRVWHLLAAVYLIGIYVIWALRIEDGAAYLVRATLLSIAALAVARLLAHAIDRIFDHGLRLSDELQQRYPGLERRLNRYFPTLRKLAKLSLVIVLVLFIGHAWGVETLAWVTEGSGRILVSAAIHILLVLGIAFFVWEFASGSIERYLAETNEDGQPRVRSARTKTLLTVARNALLVVLSVVTLLMILSEIGLNIGPLLAGAGVVGLAIGFGAQRLVQDVINGAFILFQDLMAVGDVVKLGDKAGVVEALSIRTVRLRDLAGIVHTIPFSSIEAVSNLTREFSFHVFDIGIAYREDVDDVIALIKSIGEELQNDAEIGPLILEPLEVFGLDKFGDSAIVIKGRIKTRPIKQWQVGRAFNRLVKQRFDENDIEIPFPHQTIYFGQNKDGSAPPAHLQFQNLLEASQARETAVAP